MKTVITFVTVMLLTLSLYAQNGIGNPVEGANWNNGVEGQISEYVYKNIHEAGTYTITIGQQSHLVVVEILNASAFVKFAEGQYANHNRNWINLPGAKKWNFKDSSVWYIAKCGNRGADIKFVGNNTPITHVKKENHEKQRKKYYQPGSVDTSPGGPRVIERIIGKTEVKVSDNTMNNTCREAGMMVDQVIAKYFTGSMFYGMNAANRDIAEIRSMYPSCISPNFKIAVRANKFGKWTEDNAVELLALGVAIDNNVRLRKIQNKKWAYTSNQTNNNYWPHGDDPYDGDDGGYDGGDDTDGYNGGDNDGNNNGGGINTPGSPDPNGSGRSYNNRTINSQRQGVISSRMSNRM